MIVSHAHRFVFVAVPKTGSQSVRAALRPVLGPHDWEQCGLFEQRRFPVAALAALGTGHLTCAELQPYLLPEMWRAYRRFAFVRDPVDRFRSLVRFWFPPEGPSATLDDCKRILTDPDSRARRLVRPQSDFLRDADGALVVDLIGRHDRMDSDFSHIVTALGLPPLALPLRNASRPDALVPEFDDELRAMIADVYREDFLLAPLTPRAADAA
ncbi:sulfotransferase family protein [Sphingomonas suaedae]|uniref:Sulfotransferase family protein n=1 Tax=Sphingomonas suaedae TaxID=2599297 RepID=A0A518RCE1_9SPHN|nr:sulfotransferase family 2 domain-containing protein [Sphingomonas suaedae]QDX25123.1 sulfotransferase family protein [Sphingomonas suaedae]